jgi:hypothetical protein
LGKNNTLSESLCRIRREPSSKLTLITTTPKLSQGLVEFGGNCDDQTFDLLHENFGVVVMNLKIDDDSHQVRLNLTQNESLFSPNIGKRNSIGLIPL